MTTKYVAFDTYTVLPNGGWSGEKGGYDSQSGTNRGEPPPIHDVVEVQTKGFGLGAKAAREIYTAVEQHARESNAIVRDNNRNAYTARKEARLKEADARRDARFAAFVRKHGREIEKIDRRNAIQAEIAARKAKGIKAGFRPKRTWTEELGVPTVTLHHRFPDPAKELPKKPRELDEPHPYTRTVRRMPDSATSHQSYWWCPSHGGGPNAAQTYGDTWMFGSANWSGSDLLGPNAKIQLVEKLREKLNGSDFNLGIFLGEGHQSLRLIGDTAIKLAKGLHHVKRGDFWGASRALFENTSRTPLLRRTKGDDPLSLAELNRLTRDELRRGSLGPGKHWGSVSNDANVLSARMLELQYGWRPLVSDLYGGAQALAWAIHAPFLLKERVRKRKSRTFFDKEQSGHPGQMVWYNTAQNGAPDPWGNPTCEMVTKYHATYAAKHTHKMQLIAYLREEPHALARLGLADPWTVLWELFPWSFVADWALPIGSYLQSRGFARQLVGTFVESDLRTGKSGTWSQAAFVRTVSTSLDVPSPSVKPMTKVASWQHCVNGLALLTQFATGYSAKVW